MSTPSHKRTVLVLGAGASVAEAAHFRPKRTGDYPPLDATFFRRTRKHAPQNLLDRVVSQAGELGQPDLFRDDPPVSLEQHLGRVYFEMRNVGSTHSKEAYFDLVRLYQTELLKTTNWMIGRAGCLKKLIVAELALGNELSIVTFNHDLLAENALSLLSTHRFAQRWCMEHAYGFGPVEQISSNEPEFEDECPGGISVHVPILKLHGSVNWVFRTRESYPPKNVARGTRKLFLWTNKELPARTGVQLRTAKGRNWYLWPLIVPPIYDKHGLIRGELQSVWRVAGDAMQRADQVIFWGYSFPQADLHARYFFEGAANTNEALRRPTLINPDPAAATALWDVIRPKSVKHHRHVGECLQADYN